ncbi:MAG: XdhC family protein [Peptococcaceae bacterium]|jgi:xanthine dehydrogenase accessory factor|nr:XdhC family protein [Peptococcaceae bacterium]MDH7524599.1 XdhC family protein [Peptococcaceae bacterium]
MIIYEKILELLSGGETFALAQVVTREGSAPRGAGAKMLIKKDGSIFGTVGGGDLEAMVVNEALDSLDKQENKFREYNLDQTASGNLNMQCGGRVGVFIEVVSPPPHLVIAGAGHVGMALARMASELQWRIEIADDRAELLEPALLPPGAKGVWGKTYVEAVRKTAISGSSLVVIVTRNADAEVLEEVIRRPARYLGMIGSRRKIGLIRKKLEEKGVSEELLNRVHAPIGLDIGAETPAEVAVSILAELVAVVRGGNPEKAGSLSKKDGSPGGD